MITDIIIYYGGSKMDKLHRLHLIGVRYKNYRNFENEYVNLSSKYTFKVDDRVEIKINPDPEIQGKYKELYIDKLEVNSKNNLKLPTNISYLCVVGKNGTGKTTLMQVKNDSSQYIHSLNSVCYKIYIDEFTEELYILHDYHVNMRKYKKDINFCTNKKCTVNGKERTVKFLNGYNINGINTLSFVGEKVFVCSDESRMHKEKYFHSQVNVLKKLNIYSLNLAFELSMLGGRSNTLFSQNNYNLYSEKMMELESSVKSNFDSFKNYIMLYTHSIYNIRTFENDIINFDNICDINRLNLGVEDEKEFIEFLKDIHKLFLIENKELLEFSAPTPIGNSSLGYIDYIGYNFKFFINRKFTNNETFNEIYNIFIRVNEFNKKFYVNNLNEIFNIKLTNTSSGEKHTIELLANIDSEIDERIVNIIQRKSNINEISLILNIDEPDKNMHPEWARQFKNLLNEMLEKTINYYKHEKKIDLYFQIVISTHSPFMVSDYKKNEILMLDFKDDDIHSYVKNTNKSFFGANIYDILKDSFFLKNSMGEYAKKEIEDAVEILMNNQAIDNERLEQFKNLKNEVSDLFIKDTLERLILSYEVHNDYKSK